MTKPRLFIILLAALFISSCNGEPRLSYLVPDAAVYPGYSTRGAEGVLVDKSFTATARQVRKEDAAHLPFLSSLLEKEFVVLSMTLENRSGQTIIYKPNYTALVNKVDYLRALDYTDLYEIDWDGAETLKGRFYDLDVTLAPGGKSTGLLIFRPVSKDAKSAALEVRELYIGTSTTAFSLPFKFKSEPS